VIPSPNEPDYPFQLSRIPVLYNSIPSLALASSAGGRRSSMTMTGLLLRPTRAMCRRGRLPAWAVCARAGRWSDVAEPGTHQAPITTRTKPVWTAVHAIAEGCITPVCRSTCAGRMSVGYLCNWGKWEPTATQTPPDWSRQCQTVGCAMACTACVACIQWRTKPVWTVRQLRHEPLRR
jgi:hypothetical protein